MNDLLHRLHARQVVDELERRIVSADTASAKTAQEDAQLQLAAEAADIREPPDGLRITSLPATITCGTLNLLDFQGRGAVAAPARLATPLSLRLHPLLRHEK